MFFAIGIDCISHRAFKWMVSKFGAQIWERTGGREDTRVAAFLSVALWLGPMWNEWILSEPWRSPLSSVGSGPHVRFHNQRLLLLGKGVHRLAVQISLSQVTQKNMWGNTRSIQELNRIQQWGRTHLISCTDGEYTSLETEACLIDSMSQVDKRCVALISGNTDFIRTCPYGGDLQKRIMIHQGNPFAF